MRPTQSKLVLSLLILTHWNTESLHDWSSDDQQGQSRWARDTRASIVNIFRILAVSRRTSFGESCLMHILISESYTWIMIFRGLGSQVRHPVLVRSFAVRCVAPLSRALALVGFAGSGSIVTRGVGVDY
jgi:hypothetical protein